MTYASLILNPQGRIPRLVFCALTVATVLASAAPASAEFFNPIEFLFGRSSEHAQPVQVYRRPTDAELIRASRRGSERRSAERYIWERAVSHHAAIDANGGVAYKQTVLAPHEGVAAGSLEHFAADKTLRSGDIIVTAKGFLVYNGGAHTENRISAFTPLSASKKQGALASLEKASKTPAESGWKAPSPLAVSSDAFNLKAVAVDGVSKVSVQPAAYN